VPHPRFRISIQKQKHPVINRVSCSEIALSQSDLRRLLMGGIHCYRARTWLFGEWFSLDFIKLSSDW